MAPSTLCHFQAMPSNSSYSAKPRCQSRRKKPRRVHVRKYWCTELALPNAAFGSAFHWQPVRKTNTIAAKTFRGDIGFRPPPGLRRYRRPRGRRRFGIKGSTFAHNASETSQVRIAPMPFNIPVAQKRSSSIYG